ncbi:hypothetical protein ACVWWO_000383 [Bradyrhizobium sp. F1.13.1]
MSSFRCAVRLPKPERRTVARDPIELVGLDCFETPNPLSGLAGIMKQIANVFCCGSCARGSPKGLSPRELPSFSFNLLELRAQAVIHPAG